MDFCNLKENSLNWYDFERNASCLGIGKNVKNYANVLQAKLEKVVLIEEMTEEAKMQNEQFDYILLQDKIENIESAKKYLKSDGRMLLLLNNRFGIQYFAGKTYQTQAFSTICGKNNEIFSKKEIEEILQAQGFSNYKFYYPLPNYSMPNAVFSDEYLPKETDTKLLYNNRYEDDDVFVFDELEMLKQVTKAGQFTFFANSYLVEINPKCKVKFVSFNNTRKKEYQLSTKIYDDFAVKTPIHESSKAHIENMKNYIQDLKNHDINMIDEAKDDMIVSKYMAEKSLYNLILENIKSNQIEFAMELIEKWYQFICEKFESDKVDSLNEKIQIPEKLLKNLKIVKNVYIDLVFENTFLVNNEFVFFDQEWRFENLPLEFILYRAIHNIYVYHAEIEAILPKKDVLDKFQLSQYVNEFEQIEKAIQANIIDEESSKFYANPKKIIPSPKLLFEQNNELLGKVSLLEDEEKKKEDYIEELTQKLGKSDAELIEFKEENKKKEEYILSLQKEIGQKQGTIEQNTEEIKRANDVLEQKDEIIDDLNEIIKVKDHEIEVYENMKAVKLTKKLRGLKNGNQ